MRHFVIAALLSGAAVGLLAGPPRAEAYGRGRMRPSASMPQMPAMPQMPQMPAMPSYSAPQMPYGQYPASGNQMSTYQMPYGQMQTYQGSGGSYGGTEESQAQYQAVGLYDDVIMPSSVTVPVGTIVVWKNYGRHHHTVTSDDGDWGSNELEPGGMYAYTFNLPGTYYYYCRFHPRAMHGTIVVQ